MIFICKVGIKGMVHSYSIFLLFHLFIIKTIGMSFFSCFACGGNNAEAAVNIRL